MNDVPFYKLPEFWISTFLGLIGIFISWKSFVEAGAAKDAALKASKSVKILSIRNELQEISTSMGTLDEKIDYVTARNKLDDITRKTTRLLHSFPENEKIETAKAQIELALANAREALDMVIPVNQEIAVNAPNSIYFAIEGHFSKIGLLMSALVGICEQHGLGE